LSASFEVGESLWLAANGQKEMGLACLKGVVSFTRMIPSLVKKRKHIQSMRLVGDDKILNLVFPFGVAVRNLLNTSKDVRKVLQNPVDGRRV
jgi:hypothetical protein